MGIALTLKKKLQVPAPPRLLDDSSSSSTNSVPMSERKPLRRHWLCFCCAQEEEFQRMGSLTLKKNLQGPAPPRLLDDSSSSSTNSVPVSERNLIAEEAMKFLAGVKAAGKSLPMKHWLLDFNEQGLHPGLITRAEEMFEGHPDLLVEFNMFLPEGGKCSVPE